MAKKVVVGMSGGVDSSVCAYLLKQEGYEVIGATMQIWQQEEAGPEREGSCCGLSAVDDARRVAECLDIPYYVMNFRDEFRGQVIDRFTREYLAGRTPNPCIACNQYIKWGAFYDRCRQIGADYIATGHYARIRQLENGRYTLQNAAFLQKDQTYVLYCLTQDQLAHTLMPVGVYEKAEVRKIAEEAGLPVAHKRDSQDICFVEDGDYAGFIRRETGGLGKHGYFLIGSEESGYHIVGKHAGTAAYTIGQRKGLGISLGRPTYVCRIDAQGGGVYLGDHESLMKTSLLASGLCYMGEEVFEENKIYQAKTRYSQKLSPCKVSYLEENLVRVDFGEPVRAITPGQSVVLYTDGWVAGGGLIEG